MSWAPFIAAGFMLGSIPTGLLLARSRGIDIRAHGSRNIGATNVGRVMGRRWGALCFTLDFAKGAAPTLAAGLAHGTLSRGVDAAGAAWWAAVMASPILGHMFSPWVGFRGGKGVATGLGALVAVYPHLTAPALAALAIWLAALRAWRMVGLASCLAAVSLPLSALAWTGLGENGAKTPAWPVFVGVTTLLAAVVLIKHRGNLARTFAGTEPKVGKRRAPSPDNAATPVR